MPKEPGFLEILKTKHFGTREELNEISLNRVHHHVVNSDKKSFGIVTSYRGSRTPKENAQTFVILQGMLRQAGLGYDKMKGHWQECSDSDTPYEDCPPESITDVIEPSLFVPGISLELLKSIAEKFEQDAYVYSGPETKGKTTVFFRNGGEQTIGEFSPNKIAQAYSTLKNGKNFVFEYVAQGFMQGLIETEFKRSLK